MTEDGWPLRKKYFTKYELKRMNIIDDEFLKNSKKNLKTNKLIIGGLIIVRILIIDLILNKEFEDEDINNYHP